MCTSWNLTSHLEPLLPTPLVMAINPTFAGLPSSSSNGRHYSLSTFQPPPPPLLLPSILILQFHGETYRVAQQSQMFSSEGKRSEMLQNFLFENSQRGQNTIVLVFVLYGYFPEFNFLLFSTTKDTEGDD